MVIQFVWSWSLFSHCLMLFFLIYSVISHVQFLVWVPLWGRTWGGGTLLCGCCRAVKIAVLFWFHSLFCLYCNGCLTLVWIWRCYQRTRRFRGAFFCLFWCVFFSLYSFSFLYLQYLFRGSLIIMLMKICSDRTYLLWLSSEPLNSLYQSSFCRLTPFKLFFFLLITCHCHSKLAGKQNEAKADQRQDSAVKHNCEIK